MSPGDTWGILSAAGRAYSLEASRGSAHWKSILWLSADSAGFIFLYCEKGLKVFFFSNGIECRVRKVVICCLVGFGGFEGLVWIMVTGAGCYRFCFRIFGG